MGVEVEVVVLKVVGCCCCCCCFVSVVVLDIVRGVVFRSDVVCG